MFSKVPKTYYISPTATWELQFTSLSTLGMVSIFWKISAILIAAYLVFYYTFDLHFHKGNDVGHLFMCVFPIYVSSFAKCRFKFFVHFWGWRGAWGFIPWSLWVRYMLNTILSSDIWFTNIFSQCMV